MAPGPPLRACEEFWFGQGWVGCIGIRRGSGECPGDGERGGGWGWFVVALCGRGRGPEPVADHQIVGEGMPERDRLGFDQAAHGQGGRGRGSCNGRECARSVCAGRRSPGLPRFAFGRASPSPPGALRRSPACSDGLPARGAASLPVSRSAAACRPSPARQGARPGLDIGPRGIAFVEQRAVGARP